MGIVIRPDCADLPYFLRAYFAFKMGLPFGYSKCSRGGGGQPPKCFQWFSIQNLEAPRRCRPEPEGRRTGHERLRTRRRCRRACPAKRLGLVPPRSGNTCAPPPTPCIPAPGARAAADDNTDYYPVPLKQETLRPGVVYHDPYGHVLMITKRVPEMNGDAGIIPRGRRPARRHGGAQALLARQLPVRAGPRARRAGLQALPADRARQERRAAAADQRRDRANPQYADFSLEPSKLGVEDFYDRMDDVMSPEPLDPVRAMKDAITSLEEQVKTRVTSVENGRKYQNSGRGEGAMPDGAAIFETIGAWEDFATPSRDLRLLIAIDVVRNPSASRGGYAMAKAT